MLLFDDFNYATHVYTSTLHDVSIVAHFVWSYYIINLGFALIVVVNGIFQQLISAALPCVQLANGGLVSSTASGLPVDVGSTVVVDTRDGSSAILVICPLVHLASAPVLEAASSAFFPLARPVMVGGCSSVNSVATWCIAPSTVNIALASPSSTLSATTVGALFSHRGASAKVVSCFTARAIEAFT